MVKTYIGASATAQSTTANETSYWHLGGRLAKSTTEADRQTKFRSAGTLSGLYCIVTANAITSNSTLRTRKNGGNGGQTASLTASTTGEFQDTSGTDTVASTDLLNYQFVPGAATNTISFTNMCTNFEATTNTVTRLVHGHGVSMTTASTSWFFPIAGSSAGGVITTETFEKCRMRKAGTLKNFGCRVSANRATTTTLRTRKNGANGNCAVSITGGGGAGVYEDTSNTDTVGVGEDWNYSITTGTGADTLTVQQIYCDFESTNGDGIIVTSVATGFTDNTTRFLQISGGMSNGISSEAQSKADARAAFDFSDLQVLVSANSASTTSTINLRKNAGDTALEASVTADGTGLFADNSDVVSFATTDEVDYEVTVPTEGGTNILTISNIVVHTHITVATNYERAPATETVDITESIARSKGQTRTLETETTTSAEAIVRMLASTRNPVETTSSVEALVRMIAAQRPINTETTTITDSVVREKGLPRSISETVTSSESIARMLAANRTLSETTAITDSVTRMLAANRSLATETVTITDQVQRLVGNVRTLVETVTVSDSVNRLLTATRTIQTETTTITDAINRLLAANRAILETTNITDSVSSVYTPGAPGSINYERSISETVIISESLNRMLAATRTIATESTAISDSVTRSKGANRAPETETVNITDNVNRLLAAMRQISETVLSIDSVVRQLAANRPIATETTTINDSVTRLLTRIRTILENVNVTESITRAFVGARPIVESVNITDSVSRIFEPFEIPTRLKKIREWLVAKYSETDPSL